MKTHSIAHPSVASTLSQGGLAVLRTDTIYGIVARAHDPEAVRRLYDAKHRNPEKSCIILVSDASDIPGLSEAHLAKYLELHSQRPTTLVVPVEDIFFPHLVKPHGTLAFRLITRGELHTLIQDTGPLLAPSANLEGMPPAASIDQAIDYFGDRVQMYVDGGTVKHAQPSRIMALEAGRLKVLRK